MLFRETWYWHIPNERKSEGSQGTEEEDQPLSQQKTESRNRTISKPITSGCNRRQENERCHRKDGRCSWHAKIIARTLAWKYVSAYCFHLTLLTLI
jgi:uncharacterized Rmd1/YagE family protein